MVDETPPVSRAHASVFNPRSMSRSRSIFDRGDWSIYFLEIYSPVKTEQRLLAIIVRLLRSGKLSGLIDASSSQRTIVL